MPERFAFLLRRLSRRRFGVLALGLLSQAALLACAQPDPVRNQSPAQVSPTRVPTPTPFQPRPTVEPTPTPRPSPTPVPARRVSPPARLVIPKIRVDASVVRVGVFADGEMEAPPGPDVVAWYVGSPRPGLPGNSLLTGHLDWKTETAVFWRLRELVSGDPVVIYTTENIRLPFTVESIDTYPKDQAPVDRILGFALGSVITLITCDGTFDRTARDYSHRLVVRARFV